MTINYPNHTVGALDDWDMRSEAYLPALGSQPLFLSSACVRLTSYQISL